VVGAIAYLGKQLGGAELLVLFGLMMVGIGLYMGLVSPRVVDQDVRLNAESAAHLLPRLLLIGGGVGLLSGFFGVGGGFLIVPGLVLATGMGLQNAIGTSLFAVTAFGLTTALSYAASGLVDWRIAALVIAGGILGTMLGAKANTHLAGRKKALAGIFAGIVVTVGLYIILSSVPDFTAAG
jgi:uncharacterized membrane protein YfcA